MIPKIIHYTRIGGNPMPEMAIKCIGSWNEKLPEYELRLWNEQNFDFNICTYVKQAYESRKFAFVWDYIRIRAMYHYGGLSMDTDVEVLKSLDQFLIHKGFSGFECKDIIPTGLIGFQKGHPLLKELLDFYNNSLFIKENGELNMIPNTILITNIARERWGFLGGLNKHLVLGDDFHIYPEGYFCPKDDYKRLLKNPNAYTIHYFAGSWLNKRGQRYRKVSGFFILLFKKIGIYGFFSKFWRKYVLKSS